MTPTTRRLLLMPLTKGRYRAIDEESGSEIVRSDQPLYDGARVLIARGEPPETLLTMRHMGQAHDAWEPTPIGELAKWTVEESNRGGLKRRRWRPRPDALSRVAVRPPMRVDWLGATSPAPEAHGASVDSPATKAAKAVNRLTGSADSLVLLHRP